MAEEALFLSDEHIKQVKKTIAQILYKQGMEQSGISKILSLSQPMVSNYCSSTKTATKDIRDISERIVSLIRDDQPIHFNHCISFSDKTFNGTYYIAGKTELIDNENRDIVSNLNEAFLFLKNQDLSGFIPKIKINIAQAKQCGTSPDDVAAFVNGLIIADDLVVGHNGIRFGSSKHLSSLLLRLRKQFKINAIMNIAYQDTGQIRGLKQTYLKKDFALQSSTHTIDILHHKGDFGIEPCSYIIGMDAMDVVKKLMKLIRGDIR